MNITFYENNSPISTLYPDISQIGETIEITPFNAMSIVNPEIVIDYNTAIQAANYCRISWIDSGILSEMWYFCKFRTDNGGRLIVHCERDPLYSFRNYIRHCPITVVRNGGIGAPTKINDNKLPISPNEKTVSQVPVTDYNMTDSKLDSTGIYILQCVGGQINGN